MPRFTVTVGYDWTTTQLRDVEVDADDEELARVEALRRAKVEPDFWYAARDCDGEASETEVVEIERSET